MTAHKSMLCIGGPKAGQRYAVMRGNGFRVAVTPPMKMSDHPMDSEAVSVEITCVDYRAESFNTPQGEVSFWVPAEQTPLETITILLESYEQSRGRKS